MQKNTQSTTCRTIANQTTFELITGFRRETGNQLRLLAVLMTGLLVPVLLVSLAIATQNAASNLENRRHITAFATDFPLPAVDTLRESLVKHHQIERVDVLPATDSEPMIVEIKPIVSLTNEQTEILAQTLENTGEFTFVSINNQLLQRNTAAYQKAKKLAVVFLLVALILAASTCMVVIRREMLGSNNANINLQRQLGAAPTTIAKPFVVRAALLTLIAMIGTAGLVTVFYKSARHLVDVSPYSMILQDAISIPHLILLATVSIAAACYAAITALQSSFTVINQIVKETKREFKLTWQSIYTGN